MNLHMGPHLLDRHGDRVKYGETIKWKYGEMIIQKGDNQNSPDEIRGSALVPSCFQKRPGPDSGPGFRYSSNVPLPLPPQCPRVSPSMRPHPLLAPMCPPPPCAIRWGRDFVIDNLLVRIHYIIMMIKWTGLAPWEFELPFPCSLTSTFLCTSGTNVQKCWSVPSPLGSD